MKTIFRRGAPALLLVLAAASPEALRYPPARTGDIVETVHGEAVPDPYRWLESLDSEETLGWVRAEDRLTRRWVGAVPGLEAFRKRIGALGEGDLFLAPMKAGGRYFSVRITPSGGPTGLWVQDGPNAAPRKIVDPESGLFGKDMTLFGCVPSPDARRVACTLSRGQSRRLRIRILDVSTGKEIASPALETHSVSGALVWTRDSRGFFRTNFESPVDPAGTAPPTNPSVRYYDVAGKKDTTIYTPPREPGLLVGTALSEDGRYLVLTLNEGSRTRNRVLYKDLERPGDPVRSLMPAPDANHTFLGAAGRQLFFFTDRDAPRGRVVAVDVDRPDPAQWRVIVPEAAEPVAANSAVGGNALGLFDGKFVLAYLKDGRPLLRVYDTEGRRVSEPELPLGGQIWGGFSGAPGDRQVFFRYLALSDPGTIYRLDVETGRLSIFRRTPIPIDPGSVVVEQVFFTSRDGTRIPMFIAHKKDWKKDGRSPTYLYGYGAFGWVSFVWFQPFVLNWLEMGGVYAQPSLRGGGEYGEAWHEAGARRNKGKVLEDYLAASEWLVANGYTTPSRLVANGGSASGGLAAAAILSRPYLYGAAVIDRPVLDMLRFDRFEQAAYWLPEFGSPGDPEDFRALRAWSPYHNLKKGACYPPTLVLTGDRDRVAVPLHAYKFTAAMQAAQGCANPVLLEVIWGAGHSFGATPEQSAGTWADMTAFLVRALSLRN
jgi:prolyl oligopeptidase